MLSLLTAVGLAHCYREHPDPRARGLPGKQPCRLIHRVLATSDALSRGIPGALLLPALPAMRGHATWARLMSRRRACPPRSQHCGAPWRSQPAAGPGAPPPVRRPPTDWGGMEGAWAGGLSHCFSPSPLRDMPGAYWLGCTVGFTTSATTPCPAAMLRDRLRALRW